MPNVLNKNSLTALMSHGLVTLNQFPSALLQWTNGIQLFFYWVLVHLLYKTMSKLKIVNLERVKEVIRKGMRFLRLHLL